MRRAAFLILAASLTLQAAATRVQVSAVARTTNTTSVALAITPTNGNTLMGVCSMWPNDGNGAPTYSSIADAEGTGNTYTTISTATRTSGPATQRTIVFRAYNISGSGAYSITVTVSEASYLTCFVAEYSNGANADDVAANANGSSTSPATGSMTTTTADSICIAAIAGLDTTWTTSAYASGWSRIAEETTGSTYQTVTMLEALPSSAGAQNGSMTISPTQEWSAAGACVQANASGATTYPQQGRRRVTD